MCCSFNAWGIPHLIWCNCLNIECPWRSWKTEAGCTAGRYRNSGHCTWLVGFACTLLPWGDTFGLQFATTCEVSVQRWQTSKPGTGHHRMPRWCSRQLPASTIIVTADSAAGFVPDVVLQYTNVTICRQSTQTGTRPVSSAASVKCRLTVSLPATSKTHASTANRTISGQPFCLSCIGLFVRLKPKQESA